MCEGEKDNTNTQISCSVCLEPLITHNIINNNDNNNIQRSFAKLQCGHQFHLDCIGSAFNTKGAMQCPNCRKIEKGQWLMGSASRSYPDISMDDWVIDEDLYDLSYFETFFNVQWCPFNGLTQFPSSYGEGEYSNAAAAYYDRVGQHAIFDSLAGASSDPDLVPYIAYLSSVQPPSLSSRGTLQDSSRFNNHWNRSSGPSEMAASNAFSDMEEIDYRTLERHRLPLSSSTSRRGGGGGGGAVLPVTHHRQARPNSDGSGFGNLLQPLQPFHARPNSDASGLSNLMQPFPMGHNHSSAGRIGSSMASSVIPPNPGFVARTRDRVQALQQYYNQPSNFPPQRTPNISNARRSGSRRGYSQAVSSSDQTASYYFPSASSYGRNALETQNFIQIDQASGEPIWTHNQFRPGHGSASSDGRNALETMNFIQIDQARREPIWTPPQLVRPVHGSASSDGRNAFETQNFLQWDEANEEAIWTPIHRRRPGHGPDRTWSQTR